MLRLKNRILIEAYRGFGGPNRLYLRGRILKDKRIKIEENESFLNAFRDNFLRLDSREIPDFPLRLQFGGENHLLKTDREGFFKLDVDRGFSLPPNERWEDIQIEATQTNGEKLEGRGHILLPSANSKLGVISDIDDTILKTDTLFKWKAVRNTLMRNPYQRRQIDGMSDWINALRNGTDHSSNNPVFYVSNSPRNIFSYLTKFLEINDFPEGPLLLSEWGRKGEPKSSDDPGHKNSEIERIFQTYPQRSFILLGDIASKDPQIYHHFAQKYPDQVAAIYIRDIRHRRRQRKFRNWFDQHQPNIQLIQHTIEGAKHALENRWITPASFARIEANSIG